MSQPEGARFYKCDLHAHFIPPTLEDTKFQKYCKGLHEILLDNQIDLIVLNAHRQQDLETLFKGINFLNELNDKNNYSLAIFPAIEVKDSSNTHFSIIFNKDIDIIEISNLLGAIGRKKEQNNLNNRDQCDLLDKNLSGDNIKIQKVLTDYKTVGFFPHPLLADGIAVKITGESLEGYAISPLTFLWNLGSPISENELDISLKKSNCPKDFTRTPQKYEDQHNLKNLARIKVSDAHDLKLLNKIYKECPSCPLYKNCNIGYTYLKLATPTITALKQVEYDSKTRVKTNLNEKILRQFILGMYVKGKFFKKEYFRFNPELNVLVGGRGTGKSFIIDLLRFACNSIPTDKQYLDIFKNKLIKQLGNEGKVVLFYKNNVGHIVAIKNVLIIDETTKDFDFRTDMTRTYYVKYPDAPFLEQEYSEMHFPEVFIKALSQTEIPRIHGKISSLLNIIDSFEKEFQEKKERELCVLKIEELESEILNKYNNYGILKDKEVKYGEISRKLNEKKNYLEKVKTLDLEKYQVILTINSKLINLKKIIEKWFTNIEDALNIDFKDEIFSNLNLDLQKDLAEILKKYEDVDKNLKEFKQKLGKQIKQDKNRILEKFNDVFVKWKKYYEDKYKEYKEILAENDKDFIEAVQHEVIRLEQQLKILESDLKEFPELTNNISVLENEILNQGKLILHKSLKIRSTRLLISKRIEKKLKKSNINVKIKLRRLKGKKDNKYYEWLYQIHHTKLENLLMKIQNKYFPQDLGIAIIDEELDKFSEEFPKSQRTIFPKLNDLIENSITPKIFKEKLIDLFKIYLDSRPLISFRRKRTKRYHPLDRLSIGERCAVLLYIMLLVEEIPFLVDQADSELDQESTQKFSEFLLQIKENRQILVATHNPNIPTLGDVDLLYHLDTTPSGDREIGIILKRGGFEDCIDAIIELEGGREAIERRFKKYNEKFFD